VAKIDNHISELLFEHDCVIVPDLGGFLASYSPAYIHPAQHTFSPPSKKIAFNIFLKQNDGLLTSHVSQAESITYNEALKNISGYVENCNQELISGKKFNIDKVGVLYFDVEKNLQFEPDNSVNYLRDSFGLASFQFMPVLREEFKKPEKTFQRVPKIRPSRQQRKQATRTRRKRIVNTFLLAGSVLWLSVNIYLVTPKKVNESSLNPFIKSNVEVPVINNSEKYFPIIIHESKTENAQPVMPVIENVSQGNLTPTISSEEIASEKNFFVIAGAFRSDWRAQRFASELQSQGFKDAHLVESEFKLKLVCFNSFSSRAEAMEELTRLKEAQNDCWIYEH
jgi:cell division protein FtsN